MKDVTIGQKVYLIDDLTEHIVPAIVRAVSRDGIHMEGFTSPRCQYFRQDPSDIYATVTHAMEAR